MSDPWSRTIDAVGPRLRQLRQRRDATLVDLAAGTGISTSPLSRLEAGLRRPGWSSCCRWPRRTG
ncbi:helix-turn-helix domain-containing protein [Modestobacter lacusdianchii]